MWHRPVIPAFEKVKEEEEQEFEASLGDTARPYLGKDQTPSKRKHPTRTRRVLAEP